MNTGLTLPGPMTIIVPTFNDLIISVLREKHKSISFLNRPPADGVGQ
jgi:hypothetical protein